MLLLALCALINYVVTMGCSVQCKMRAVEFANEMVRAQTSGLVETALFRVAFGQERVVRTSVLLTKSATTTSHAASNHALRVCLLWSIVLGFNVCPIRLPASHVVLACDVRQAFYVHLKELVHWMGCAQPLLVVPSVRSEAASGPLRVQLAVQLVKVRAMATPRCALLSLGPNL